MKQAGHRTRSLLVLASVVIVALGLDQITKHLVRSSLGLMQPHDIIPGVLQLLYIQNRGAAFGLFQGSVTVLSIIAILMIVAVVLFFFFSKKASTLEVISLSLIVAGALGNLFDRISLGFVTDFIYLEFIHFPIFNIADMFVTAGTICFVVWILFYSVPADGKENPPDKGIGRSYKSMSSNIGSPRDASNMDIEK